MDSTKILVVDDDPFVRDIVTQILQLYDHDVVSVDSGQQALATVDTAFDVIVMDINMPDMDGFQTLAALNEKNMNIPVLILTGAGSLENAIRAINLGAYDFIEKPILDPDLFEVKVERAIEKRRYVKQERAYKVMLEEEVRKQTKELAEKNALLQQYSLHLESSTMNIIMTLQAALEEKDIYTAGHTSRVTRYALMIGEEMLFPKEDIQILERAAKLHDIGKLVIDSSAMNKPGPLNTAEWEWLRKHPEVGANILKPLGFLKREEEIIRQHHEWVDGHGYPCGLGGSDLDMLTKIVTVADCFDAMTSRRSYKRNMTHGEAVSELNRCANTQFDQLVVDVFTSIMGQTA
jgi:putative nucleotidyltransferase with HDIG domain